MPSLKPVDWDFVKQGSNSSLTLCQYYSNCFHCGRAQFIQGKGVQSQAYADQINNYKTLIKRAKKEQPTWGQLEQGVWDQGQPWDYLCM